MEAPAIVESAPSLPIFECTWFAPPPPTVTVKDDPDSTEDKEELSKPPAPPPPPLAVPPEAPPATRRYSISADAAAGAGSVCSPTVTQALPVYTFNTPSTVS
jgi:hypothetical protein